MKRGRSYIFDSFALLKLFQKEQGYKKVIFLLENIEKKKLAKYLNAINLGEIIYTTKRVFGDQKKLETLANVERLRFTILPVTNDLIFEAAEYKAEYSISYADCFVVASALQHGAIVVTGDPEFKKVEHLLDIEWI
ncbi:MAG: type II toxin-antitoxin system VapC family toxin [Thermodesulfobacteriota bacterium]|nr:type II toxin-antitoxin system VapC family toxin [Thermodesulfobacteriota bacterium]